MWKVFWSIAILIVVAVGAVVVAPSFIDWNQYKGMAQDKVRELTGRELNIAGKVHITIWPAPALVAEDITFSSLPGSQSPNIVSLKAVEVRIAFAPLLSGKFQIQTVKLIEPIIELERLADGRANWEIKVPEITEKQTDISKAGSGSDPPAAISTPDIILDNFTIANGTVIYRDTAAGIVEPVEKLNATIAADSLHGPLESNGSMVLRGMPLNYSLSLGEIIQERTVPFNAQVSLQSVSVSVKAGGSLVNLRETPQFKGSVKLKSQDLGVVLKSLGMILPGADAPIPLDASGEITASAEALEIKDLTVEVLNVQAKGDLQVDLADKVHFDTQLAINQIDTDKLLAALKKAPMPTDGEPNAQKKPVSFRKAKPVTKTKAAKVNTPLRFTLPDAIAGSMILTVDAVGYKNGVIRDVLVNAELVDGVLRLGQVSAEFPGGSDFNVQGELTTSKQVPTFTGDVSTVTNDLRSVLSWLSIKPPPVPADRLRRVNFKSQILVTPEQIQLTGLDVGFDSSRLNGGVILALRKRPGIGAALVIDRFNADAYLPAEGKIKRTGGSKKSSKSTGADPVKKLVPNKRASTPLSALGVLNTFDANFNLHIKSAVYKGTPVKDLVAEGMLYNGALDLKRLSVGRLAGASARMSGKLAGLSSVPEAKNIRFSAKARDLAAIGRMSGTKLPPLAKKLGAASIKGRLDGSLLAPTVDAALGLAGAAVTYRGRISAMSTSDMLSGKFTLRHRNLPKLLRRLGINYRPAGRIGGIDLTAAIKGGAETISLSAIQGRIGKTSLGGSLSAQFTGTKPHVKADLKTSALNIEHFLPSQKNAAIKKLLPTLVPASWRSPLRPAFGRSPNLYFAARGKWPTKPLDLSALHLLNADIALKAPIVIYDRYLAEQTDIIGKITNGVLDLERFSGRIFGGALSGRAQAAADSNSFASSVRVSGLNIEDALKAVTGEAAANGKMDVAFDINSSGRNVANMISALGGKANFSITGMDVDKAVQGSLLSGLLGLFTSLNQLGGKVANDKASVSASFDIARGIATTRDLKLASTSGNGAAVGSINLPNWTIDIKGQVKLAESMLMKV